MYKLNDGLLYLYEKVPNGTSERGIALFKLSLIKTAWFADLGIRADEYYDAQIAEIEIERRVRILEDKKINQRHAVVIDGTQYKVGRVWSGPINETRKIRNDFSPGTRITDITLERVEDIYEIDGV